MESSPVTLLELNNTIKAVVKQNLNAYWLTAEISELSVNYSGHCYIEFIQKDKNEERIVARSRAIIWSNTFRMIKPYFETTTGQTLSEGMKVMVKVKVEFHEVYSISLTVIDIEPTYTVGEVAVRKQKIIEKLNQEGVLDMNKELELPYLTNKIAVISSASAAGYEDFIDQLENNPRGFKFYHKLFPAIMQGNEAEGSIIRQLEQIFNYIDFFDAVIIIRGGGAVADLDCFNSYWLAYNITQFPLPILSGIGHEQDDSVVDVIAHTRLKTPTAVAEFLIDNLTEIETELYELQDSIVEYAKLFLQQNNSKLRECAYRFQNTTVKKLQTSVRLIDTYPARISNTVRTLLQESRNSNNKKTLHLNTLSGKKLQKEKNVINTHAKLLQSEAGHLFKQARFTLDKAEQSILLHDPKHILNRGFSITTKNGEILKDASLLTKGDKITTRYSKGKSDSVVE